MPVASAWDAYYSWAVRRKAVKTLELERGFWEQFLDTYPRQLLDDITVLDAERFQAWLASTPSRNGAPRSPHTINAALRSLCSIFEQLRHVGYTGANPFKSSELPRPKARRGRIEYLTRKEIEKALSTAETAGRDTHLFVALGIYAGLRKGEALDLRWADISFERAGESGEAVGCITVWDSQSHSKKTSGSNRVVPLHPALKAVLAHYRPLHGDAGAYIIRPRSTEPLSDGYRWNTRRAFEAVSRELGRKVYPHLLRHTFASQLAMRGVSLHKIGAWMGHSSVTTTEIYAHLCPLDSEIGRL